MGHIISAMSCLHDTRKKEDMTPDQIATEQQLKEFEEFLAAANAKLLENGVDVEALAMEAG